MNRNKKRLVQLENKIERYGDLKEFQDARREAYNLPFISDAALIALLRADLGEIELPEWARAEIEAPIPTDAPKHLLQEATRKAEEEMNNTLPISDNEIQSLPDGEDEFLTKTLGLTSYREAQWLFEIVLKTGDQYGFVHTAYREGKYPIPEDYP